MPVLLAEHLDKRYGALRALDDVSIELGAHEVVGVLGANGAGKSTLLQVLAGMCRPDEGRIVVRGCELRLDSPRAAAAAGIAIATQEQALLPNLSVAENIMLGHEGPALRFGCYRWKRLHTLAAAQLRKVGACIDPAARTETLAFAERQMIELARALAVEERTRERPIILLDEPTSMLDETAREAVLRLVERLRERASVLLVTHRLDEAVRVCDRIVVLAGGRRVGERHRGAFDKADLHSLMLGADAVAGARAAAPAPLPAAAGPVVLAVRGLTLNGRYRDVSLDLRAGEVLGIAGVAGSGRESLCRTLFGAEAADSGEILLDGRPVRWAGPADAVRAGFGYVPAERAAEGLVGAMSVAENLTLAHLDECCRGPFIDAEPERQRVRQWVERLHIKTPGLATPADRLSGGNQQKLVLAKWLAGRGLRVLLLDHPWRGLDPGAKAEAESAVQAVARTGVAAILLADRLEDLSRLAHRLLVMREGEVCARFAGGAARPTEQRVLECML